MTEKKKPYCLCLFLHSGSFARVYEAMSMANVVVAKGGEVHMLFSYGAIKRLVQGGTDEVGPDEGALGERFTKALERGAIDTISEMMEMGKRFGGLNIYACTAAMGVLNVSRDELIDGVDATSGLVGFLDLVKGADLTLYI